MKLMVLLVALIGAFVLACSSTTPAPIPLSTATTISKPTVVATLAQIPPPTLTPTLTQIPPPILTPTPNAWMLEIRAAQNLLKEEYRLEEEASDWFEQGASLFNSEQYGEAIKAFDKAIEIGPNVKRSDRFYGWRGSSYMELGQYENAIQDITSAIQFKPTATRYRNRAVSYQALGQFESAIQDYTNAIQREPTATRYRDRAASYRALGDFANAASDDAKACSLASQYCPTAVAPTPTVTPTKTPTVIDFESGSLSFEDDWGGESLYGSTVSWEPVESDGECHNNSDYAAEHLSPTGRKNIELIFGKKADDVVLADIKAMERLKFQSDVYFEKDNFGAGIPDYWRPFLESYEGLEYLTCLQWLDLGYMTYGRDHRFLSSLSKLTYLNLNGFTDFENIDLLTPITNLETLILPVGFKSLPELAHLKNLKKIDARGSRSCNIEPVLELPKIEQLLIGATITTDSDYQSFLQAEGSDSKFDISLSPSGKYLQLLIPGGSEAFNQELDSEESGIGWENKEYMIGLVQSIYDLVDDQYDEIVFVGNAEESSASYAGTSKQVSNNIGGLGAPVWSAASCFGSNGNLRGLISLPTKNDLIQEYPYYDGSLIHESLHLWGGGHLLPRIELWDGSISGGHWGVTSANGILGGFDLNTLETIVFVEESTQLTYVRQPNGTIISVPDEKTDDGFVYRTAYFNTVGNSGLLPMSPLELYMMGVLPADQLPDTVVFKGVSETNPDHSCEDYGYEWWDGSCFRAEEQYTVSVEDIIQIFGERPYEGEIEVSILVVAVSETPLTGADWSLLDEKIAWNAQTSDNGIQANNVWEASGGKVRFVFPPAEGQ